MSKAQKDLDKKLARVKFLSKEITSYVGTAFDKETNQEIENVQFKMEFALSTLLNEMQNKEADVKIEHMEKLVNILKNARIIQKV